MANIEKYLLCSMVLVLAADVCQSSPRIDGFGNSSNLIEYQYRYSVDESKSQGPVMDRWEHRIGEYVKGAYSVLEPDGRIRTVDYEVDGPKGYHAVVRMNEPGPGLLSFQQLTKSSELFPAAVLPIPSSKPKSPTRNARNDGKIWNYHSKSPYINEYKSEQRDHKAAASSQISTEIASANKLPLSPVNYNVPQTRKLIHFLKPAAYILDGKNTKNVKRSLEKEKFYQAFGYPVVKDTEQRRLRNSKLVKRFKSMDEVRN